MKKQKQSKVAQLKIMMERTKGYASIIQFAMIVYIFIINTTFDPMILIILLVISMIVIAGLDFKYLLPREQRVYADNNPVMDEIRSRLKRIENKVNES